MANVRKEKRLGQGSKLCSRMNGRGTVAESGHGKWEYKLLNLNNNKNNNDIINKQQQ